ncbi:MAG: outer membrane protein assembly factor BamE [Pseudomonadota bacterium]
MQLLPLKLSLRLLLLSFFIALSSCSYFMPHRIDIQQGNIIEQEKVNQLKPGMRKDQVQFILGTPMLIDVFHNDRWDYIHTIKKGHSEMKKTRLSLYFEDDELINIVGDIRPGVEVVKKAYQDEIIIVPLKDYDANEDTPWYSWLMWWDDEGKKTKKQADEPQPNQVNTSAHIPEIIEERKRN